MSERLRVDEPGRLLEFLRRSLPSWKRKTLEQRIAAGCVLVNGAGVLRNELVAAGDEVEVVGEGESPRPTEAPFPILFEDEHVVAIDKPAGLLSVSTDQELERTALAQLREALSRPKRPARLRPVQLWPVHRLDRETSGVLLFARTPAARDELQGAWELARKHYLAIVEGRPEPSEGLIEEPLLEDDSLRVLVGARPGAKPARTRYRTERTHGDRSQLAVLLETGRKHQIRAHLAWLGHPVVGDERYGTAEHAKDARLGLHAHRLVVPHPADGSTLRLEAPPPRALLALLRTRAR
jgi:23S rRNA pseudouridine1911/1915/1917 synthase